MGTGVSPPRRYWRTPFRETPDRRVERSVSGRPLLSAESDQNGLVEKRELRAHPARIATASTPPSRFRISAGLTGGSFRYARTRRLGNDPRLMALARNASTGCPGFTPRRVTPHFSEGSTASIFAGSSRSFGSR